MKIEDKLKDIEASLLTVMETQKTILLLIHERLPEIHETTGRIVSETPNRLNGLQIIEEVCGKK